jgi:hypothetical protein
MAERRLAIPGVTRHGRQRGAALLIFMILLVTAALTYVVTSLTPAAVEARRMQTTQESLLQAREALIGYALKYREEQIAQGQPDRVYGYLPLPDLGTARNNNVGCDLEGCDAANFTGNEMNATVIGRLPWRTLGIAPLRDGHGECLWLAISGSHQRQQRVTPMNWDTLGQLDVVVANGSSALASVLASAHDRPVAVIFSPGPPLSGQDRGSDGSSGNDVGQCGGNYEVANYLDPASASALGGVTNYLAGLHHASGVTGDGNPANDPDAPKQLITGGRIYASGGNFLPNACQGSDCTRLANDIGLPLSADLLFGSLRNSAYFRQDINAMLERMVDCLRDQFIAGPQPASPYGRIEDSPSGCYGAATQPLGYYPHYRELVFVAKPTASATVTTDGTLQSGCTGALVFAGQRSDSQSRASAPARNDYTNYLEGDNLASFAAASASGIFSGAGLLARAAGGGQTKSQDIVRCIPSTASFAPAESPGLAALGVGQLVAYDPASRTLVLGRENVTTGVLGSINAGALFGCAWTPEVRALGNGVRAYFRFRFKIVGTNVGFNGFVFALADGERNGTAACGMAGSHLGYSGNNGTTPKIDWPKIGIEFDQGRNTGFPGTAGEASVNAGRNDPCGTTAAGCAGHGYNSHAAIVYWGNAATNGADGVTLPDNDDNVHGLPATPPASRPPPTSPNHPSAGFAFKDLRGKTGEGGDSYLYHVRVEITPTRNSAAAAENSTTSLLTKVWLLADSGTVANQIAAMRNTTRPMSELAAGFVADLQDTATLYDVGQDRGGCGNCLAGESCGTDNICYRQALRTLRPGFTGAQRTTDQEVHISDYFSTWIP